MEGAFFFGGCNVVSGFFGIRMASGFVCFISLVFYLYSSPLFSAVSARGFSPRFAIHLPSSVKSVRLSDISAPAAVNDGLGGLRLTSSASLLVDGFSTSVQVAGSVARSALSSRLGRLAFASGPAVLAGLGIALVDVFWDDLLSRWRVSDQSAVVVGRCYAGSVVGDVMDLGACQSVLLSEKSQTYPDGCTVGDQSGSPTVTFSVVCTTSIGLQASFGGTWIPDEQSVSVDRDATESDISDSLSNFLASNPDFAPDVYRYLISRGVDLPTTSHDVVPSHIPIDLPVSSQQLSTGQTVNLSRRLDINVSPDVITVTDTVTRQTVNPDGSVDVDVTEYPPSDAPVDTVSDFEFPAFCDWASIVCDFIDWFVAPADEPPDLPYDPINTVDVDPADQTVSVGSAGSCPPDYVVTVYGVSLSLSYQVFCDFADRIRPLVIAFAYLSAAFLIVRA